MVEYKITESRKHNDSYSNADIINWSLLVERSTIDTRFGRSLHFDSSKFTYEFLRNGNLQFGPYINNSNSTLPAFELCRTRMILGGLKGTNWWEGIGLELIDIGNDGSIDFINMGANFPEIGNRTDLKHPSCDFYNGPKYLIKFAEANPIYGKEFLDEQHLPSSGETGFLKYRVGGRRRLVPSNNSSIRNIFNEAGLAYDMLRSGIGLLSDDFPDPEAIEDGARVMLRRFLESGVVDAYLADSDSD